MVESFAVDHTRLNAPIIRIAKIIEGRGDRIVKFDLRFLKPNTDVLPSTAIHSMEHLMAVATREVFNEDDVIDFSPMGCRTGFYFTVYSEDDDVSRKKIIESIERAIESPLVANTPVECGNFRMHNEALAKKLFREFLDNLQENEYVG